MTATTPRFSQSAPLRVAFMGSPDFAVPALERLLARPDVKVLLAVSQPDKPAGRGRELRMPAVKEIALRAGVEIAQPQKLKTPPFSEVLRPLDLDLVVVVAYGKILPPDLLAVPRFGCWNLHGSLLPKYRGAAPIQRAVLAGERESGVTLMQMEAGLDTGPMMRTRVTPIGDDDTAGTLFDRLSHLGAELLDEGLDALAAGTLTATAQDDAQATLAPMLDKSEGRIDWSRPASTVRDHIRGMDPWPGAFTDVDGELLKVWGARIVEGHAGAPGTVAALAGERLVVACGEGAVSLAEGQLPGKKRMAMGALVKGRSLAIGQVIGQPSAPVKSASPASEIGSP